MIKSEKNETLEFTEYPCLGIKNGENYLYVVLFTDYKKGIVVYAKDDTSWCIGDYFDNWNMKEFKPFIGKIELSNA